MSSENQSKLRRTRIVCTIGPATSSEPMLRKLVKAGMDCARLNFSHGTPPEHLKVIKAIRSIVRETGKEVAILQDLPGPKFRVGTISGGSVLLRKGSVLTLTTRDVENEQDIIPLRSKELPRFAPEGGVIYLSDGTIRLRVLSTTDTEIKCRCEIGGMLLSGKGVNVPQLKQGFETFTKNDKKFLAFGIEHGVDLVAVSFVRKASDIKAVRWFIERTGKDIPIVAKIEKREAVENIEEIAEASDALMVARGDLGVENPLEQIPELQKQIISSCTASGVPVITATQMLESMMNSPSPTRAEVTDVANAIFDGTDAVMLSEETAMGKYPIECVRVLDKVSLNAEERMRETRQHGRINNSVRQDLISEAIGKAAADLSNELGARTIVTFLDSIGAVSKISSLRPLAPIVVMSKNESDLRRLKIVWGVYPMKVDKLDARDVTSTAVANLEKERFLRSGDKSVVVCLDAGRAGQSTLRMQVLQTG